MAAGETVLQVNVAPIMIGDPNLFKNLTEQLKAINNELQKNKSITNDQLPVLQKEQAIRQEITPAMEQEKKAREELKLKQKQNTDALKLQSKEATNNLGVNLGLLFGVMSITRAYQQMTDVIMEYGNASEKTRERMQKINKVINLAGTLLTTYITLMMLRQALESKGAAIQLTSAGATGTQTVAQRAHNAAMKQGIIARVALWFASNPLIGLAILAGLAAVVVGAMAATNKFQSMGSFVATEPQMIMVGEHPERVNVTPMGGGGGSGGEGVHYHFHGPVYGVDNLKQHLNNMYVSEKQRG